MENSNTGDKNKIKRLSFDLEDGTRIDCSKEKGFSTLLEAILRFRGAAKEVESLRVAFAQDILAARGETSKLNS